MNRDLLSRSLPILLLLSALACAESAQTQRRTGPTYLGSASTDSINVDSLFLNAEAAGFEKRAGPVNDTLLGALRPGGPASFLAWRKGFVSAESGAFKTLASVGQPCKGDSASCRKAFNSLDPEGSTIRHGAPVFPSYSYLAVTRGDSAFTVTSPEEAVRFLSPIDTAAEAELLLTFEGTPPDYMRAWPGEGFVALASVRVSDCPVGHQTLLIRVFPDGRTETVGRGQLRQDEGICI